LTAVSQREQTVKVHATAITPTELQWFPTFKTPGGEPRPFPIVLSHEFSGVIADLGSGVGDFEIGDAVYGMNDWFANGALAGFCVASASAVALKPRVLDHAQAAVVPISALTAWQGLFDRGGLESGQRVLIHGGSGGVGVFAVQLAHWRGAHVIATASARNLDFVREIGADEVIEYKITRFEEVVRDVDVVFDSVGGETLERSWRVLNPGGRAVTIAAQSEATKDARTRAAFFIVEPNRAQLSEIARLLDGGTLQSFVEAVFPLDDARQAYARALRGGMRGKIVLQVTAS
jgi:NADPH:quinone reductase-like Zn-dependent oxidoreductase